MLVFSQQSLCIITCRMLYKPCQSIIFGFSLVSHCTKAIFLMHFQRPQCRNSKYYRWEPSLLHYNNLNLWIGGLKLKILYIMNRMHLHLHLQHLYLYSLSLNSPNHIRTMHGLQAPSLICQKFWCLPRENHTRHTHFTFLRCLLL